MIQTHTYVYSSLGSLPVSSYLQYLSSTLSSLSPPIQTLYPLQLLVVVNGKDNLKYTLSLPPGPSTTSKWQYYIAGGAVSSHTLERHIQLVNADTSNITWRLGSLQVLKGSFMHSILCDMSLVLHVYVHVDFVS